MDPTGQLDRHPRPARASARRPVARGVGQLAPPDSPGGLVVAGMGGSAIGGAWPAPCSVTAPRVRSPSPAATRCRRGRRRTRPCCARATRARPRRRWPPTRPPGASAPGGSSARPAARWPRPARADGVPVIPLPGGYQPRAAVGYALVVALEVAALAGRRPRPAHRDRRRRRARRAAGRRVGPRRRARTRWPSAWPAPARHDPPDRRRRADRADRLPLEDPDQRERQAAVLRRRAARARSQRDRRLGGGRGAGALQRRVARRLRPASTGPRRGSSSPAS